MMSPTARLLTVGLAAFSIGTPSDGWSQAFAGHRSKAQLAINGGSDASVLQRPARLSVHDVQLDQALRMLSESAAVQLSFSPSLVSRYPEAVSCDCDDRTISVENALDRLLVRTPFAYTEFRDQVLVYLPTQLRPGITVPWLPRVALAASSPPLQGQRTGTVTGRVTDASTARPIASAQVSIEQLGVGALTQQNGRFILTDVPAGAHTLRVQLIGYRPESRPITVADGQTVNVEFSLSEQALALDEVVVTGTPGGTQRRAIGNVVGQINAAEITEITPVTTMQDLLGPREPGLNFLRGQGIVGAGGGMRIRGLSSLALNSQPLIYVDGIRVDNSSQAGPNLRDGSQVSTLDDLAPSEIESIEIIKGPAAATLYGTEASAGVIQIITKRGRIGAPQFDIGVSLGSNWLSNVDYHIGESWGRDASGNPIRFNIYQKERAEGREWFQNGPLQTYTGSMRGGTELVRYYLNAEYLNQEGIVSYNWKRQTNLRGNISVKPSDKLTLDVNMGYVDGLTSFMQQKISYGIWDQMVWANAEGQDTRIRGFLRARPEKIAEIEATREVNRVTGSATLTHIPLQWLTQRLIVGTDWGDEFNSVLVPRFPEGLDSEFGSLALGDLQIDNPVRQTFTLDYGTTASYGWGPELTFKSSIGAQYYDRQEHVTAAHGQIFPAPQIRTIGGATNKTADQWFIQNKSLGMYVQQEMGWNGRAFLTAAVRGDDNSAFGTEYDAAIYPKVSGTWVVSEEGFWENLGASWVNSLRLRSAWGKAGRQPDVFAAVTLYQGEIGPQGQPAISTNVLGNPALGPEVSTELEMGFDAAFFDDRASTEFTYYTRKVEDALLSVPVNPTTGFSGSRSVNAGQLSSWGWELAADVSIVEGDRFGWEIGATVSSNDNRIDDMTGITSTGELREGRPFPFFSRRKIVQVEYATADGGTGTWPNPADPDARVARITRVLCDGGTGPDGYSAGGDPVPCNQAPEVAIGNGRVIPKYEGSVFTTLTLLESLRLYAMAEWRGEHWASSIGLQGRQFIGSGGELSVMRPARWANGLAQLDGRAGGLGEYNTFNSSFAMLREVSLNYTLPTSLAARIGASRASINVATRNPWMIWQAHKYRYGMPIDPEGRDGSGNVLSTHRLTIPPLTSFVVSTRVSF